MITPYRSADKIAEPKRPIVIPWPTFDVDSMGSQDQGAFAAHFLVWLFVNVVGLIAGFVDYVAPGRAPIVATLALCLLSLSFPVLWLRVGRKEIRL